MKIRIRENGKTIRINFPAFIVFNSISLKLAQKYATPYLEQSSVNIDGIDKIKIANIRKTLKKVKKMHKNLNLVQVRSADGGEVEVKL